MNRLLKQVQDAALRLLAVYPSETGLLIGLVLLGIGPNWKSVLASPWPLQKTLGQYGVGGALLFALSVAGIFTKVTFGWEIRRLKKLMDEGCISEQDFEVARANFFKPKGSTRKEIVSDFLNWVDKRKKKPANVHEYRKLLDRWHH